MLVLGIETSCSCGSVALAQDSKVLGELFFNTGLKHSTKIVPSIKTLLNTVDRDRSDLDGISVSSGPGSYTSLRIGISIAKGLAYSLDIPLTGISTLQCVAFNTIISEDQICSVIDAKKGQLYSAFFRYNLENLERISEDEIVGIDNLCNKIIKEDKKTVFIGDGLNLYKSTFVDKINGLVLFAPGHLCYPRASSCAIMGVYNFMKAKRDEVNTLVPTYIRKADAELLDNNKR